MFVLLPPTACQNNKLTFFSPNDSNSHSFHSPAGDTGNNLMPKVIEVLEILRVFGAVESKATITPFLTMKETSKSPKGVGALNVMTPSDASVPVSTEGWVGA